MKKQFLRFLSAASAAATMCACTGLHASAEVADRIMGDLDNDCRVTLYDCVAAAELCTNALLGLTGDAVTEDNYPADIDMDGKITLSDLLAMTEYYTLEMLGIHPLWADLREVSYVENPEMWVYSLDEGERVLKPQYFTLSGLYVEIGCVSGKPGEEVTVPVYAAAAGGLSFFMYCQSVSDGYTVTNGMTPLADEDDMVFWNPRPEDNHGNTCLVWGLMHEQDATSVDISEGAVIAEFTYKIPDDAQPGDTCIIKPYFENTSFTGEKVENGETTKGDYQYTAVNGVIFVE